MRLRRRLLRLGAALVALAAVVFATTAVRVWQVARQDHRRPADAIVVLGASQYDGRPSAVFRARLDHAVELHAAQVAPRVVTVGGNRAGDRYTEAGAGADYLHRAGVPATDVLEVPVGTDTLSSLRAAARLLRERGWRRVVLVTDPWHSMRSDAMAEDVGLSAQTSPVRGGPADSGRTGELRYLLRETAAYLHYRVFGGSRSRSEPGAGKKIMSGQRRMPPPPA